MALIFPQLSGQQEAQAVLETEQAAAAADPAAGDALFVVSNKWFSGWCQYSGFVYDPVRKKPKVVPQQEPAPRPGPIDNSDLVAEPPSTSDLTSEQQAGVVVVRDQLVDKHHFWMVHEPTWNLLKEWYGCKGPEVRREYHMAGHRIQLEAQQQHYRVIARPAGAEEQEAVVGCSAMCKLSELKTMACSAMGLEADDYDVYDYRRCQQGANLEATTYKTLTGNKLQDQQAVLLLPRGRQVQPTTDGPGAADINIPSSPVLMLPATTTPLRLGSPHGSSGLVATSPMSPLSRSFDRAPPWADDVVYDAPGRARGLAGLGNLGNTCFMNSSLQCLAHSLPLMQTFLTGAYKRDLNKDNPLSLGGKLALAFGALMDKLWRGGVGHVSPKLFKWQLAKFCPQFSGYAQEDSQELLAFLLDGLHEDLNRITDKPYIEDKDSDGRPDEEVAAEAWANYRRRNDSVIVDAFQGLYRSVLTCPQCEYQSVKFDPLMYLSLPLPSSKMRGVTFTAVFVDGTVAPRTYGIEVPKSATVGQLYAGIAELLGLATEAPEDVLLLTQFNMSDASFAVYADSKARVSSIEDLRSRSFFHSRSTSHLYIAYVYPSSESGPRSGKHPVHIFHRARSSRPEWPIPATPLFLPDNHLAALRTEMQSLDYPSHVVAPGGGRDTIDAALEQLLRPFRRPQAPAPAAQEDAVFGSDSIEQQQQAEGPAPMDEAPISAVSVAAGPEAAAETMMISASAADHEAMELEQGGPGRGPPNGSVDAEAIAKSGGDEAWLDSMPVNGTNAQASGLFAADVPMVSAAAMAQSGDSEEIFDLWSAQKEDAAKAAAAAAAAAATSPPFLLKAAKRAGYNMALTTYSVILEVPEDGQPLLLVAEWQDAAGQLYDPHPLLDAEKDASALALAEKQRDGGKSVTLAECLETFLQPEQLDAEDRWYCGKCKQHVQADKKLDLWSLPDVLVVHLKRFSYSRYSRDKLDTLVDFPLRDLDMTPYLRSRQQHAHPAQQQQQSDPARSTRYDLYAVSNHYGGMGGGHYTAYCRMPGASGGWHTFDDGHVGRMEESGVKTSAAYVLFYRRQGAQADEDVQVLLERADAEAQQELVPAAAAAGVVAEEQAGPAGAAAEQHKNVASHAAPHPTVPSTSASSLRKRQPAAIYEEGAHDIPAAGAIEID